MLSQRPGIGKVNPENRSSFPLRNPMFASSRLPLLSALLQSRKAWALIAFMGGGARLLGLVLLAVAASTRSTYSQTAPPVSGSHGNSRDSRCSGTFKPIGEMFECGADEFSAAAWQLTAVPALPCKGDEIAVAFQNWGGRDGSAQHWIAKKIERTCQLKVSVSWADSRNCPTLIAGLKSISALAAPQLLAPGFDRRSLNLVLDGAFFTVRAPVLYPAERALGAATLSGNTDSPVGKWVGQELGSLGRCWSETKPIIP